MSTPLDLPKLPPEAEALLDDPRLADMADALPGFPRTRRILAPRHPPAAGESRYLSLCAENDEALGDVVWLNKPNGLSFGLRTGRGLGLSLITRRPRIEERKSNPGDRVDVWSFRGWLVASARFVEIAREADPDAIETLAVDWIFADGTRLEGYSFVDVVRRLHAYDYARTSIIVEMEKGRRFIAGLARPRALKRDIDPAIHAFRDDAYRSEIFVSRLLAKALAQGGVRGIRFEDPVSVDAVQV